jgi:hypothetical protein
VGGAEIDEQGSARMQKEHGDLSEYQKYQLFGAHGIASATGVRLEKTI